MHCSTPSHGGLRKFSWGALIMHAGVKLACGGSVGKVRGFLRRLRRTDLGHQIVLALSHNFGNGGEMHRYPKEEHSATTAIRVFPPDQLFFFPCLASLFGPLKQNILLQARGSI